MLIQREKQAQFAANDVAPPDADNGNAVGSDSSNGTNDNIHDSDRNLWQAD